MTVEENSPTEEQPEESVEEPETTPEVVTVEPDPLLQSLYGSDRPSIQLCDGVPLAPVVCTVWPSTPPEKLLQENWIPEPAENEEPPPEDAPPPPSFDPTDLRFQELPWRLSKSAAMKAWCSQKRSVEELEAALVEAKDGEEKQAQEAKLEEVKAKLEEAAAALEELKASFEPDASSLVPWMRRLFAYADAGITSFEAGAVQFPVCDLRKLFGQGDGQELVAGTEKLLGTFKRRFEMERGAGTVQVFCRLLPNTFREGFVAAPAAADDGEAAPSSVEAAVDRMRANLGASPDAPASTLDLVQVNWWDFRGGDVLAVLRELARLGEPKTETDEGTGEVTVVEPAKVAALGLVDFPYRAVLDALQAGIKLACVQLPYNLACRDTAETLALCKEYGVQVLMRGSSLSGLVDERFVGVPRPNAAAEVDGLSWPALALEEADLYGGWPKAQLLLRTIKAIADKHRVKMQTVAMRWQLDQGGVPMFTATLSSNPWSSFGARWLADDRKPGADSQLFHSASFLDDEDLAQLAAL